MRSSRRVKLLTFYLKLQDNFVEVDMKCEYGCGLEAKYQIKSGRWCCSKSSNSCPVNRAKNSKGLKTAYKEGRKRVALEILKNGWGWNKGLTKETDERLKRSAETLKKRYKSGEIAPGRLGKKHTKETKEKMSRSARGGNSGFVKTKYYDVYCPFKDEIIKVQGTWELKYSEFLNERKVNWIRSRKISLRYCLDGEDYKRIYYPDFYLPDDDLLIEIKGYYPDYERLKMKCVIKQNKDKKIIVLLKEDLLKLGIKIT